MVVLNLITSLLLLIANSKCSVLDVLDNDQGLVQVDELTDVLGTNADASQLIFDAANVDSTSPVELVDQKTTIDMIIQYNYPYEVHQVITEDGYILQLHRIPRYTNRGVVFLMHGLMSSSADWVVIGPQKALSFLLYNAGYDVWMGNARGNKYSRLHITLDPDDDSDYWNFSWHEIGTIDLPTMIDYVLEQTKQNQLTYVGHSQGTTSFFVMASEIPEYNSRIKSMHALAPIALMDKVTNIFVNTMMTLLTTSKLLTKLLGQFEFMPSSDLVTLLGRELCPDEEPLQPACTNLYFIIAGYNPSQFNETLLEEIVHNVPAGASSKQLIHYGQVLKSKKFQHYDEGILHNLRKYGTSSPPEYDISRITAPVALYVGLTDDLAVPYDVQKLAPLLPNLILHYLVPIPDFLHSDFIWAEDVKPLLYDKVLDIIAHY